MGSTQEKAERYLGLSGGLVRESVDMMGAGGAAITAFLLIKDFHLSYHNQEGSAVSDYAFLTMVA